MTRGGGGIEDDALNLKYGYDRLWATHMQGMQGAAGVDVSLGAGGQQAELSVAASELNGVSLDTGDEIYFMLNPRKWDCDFTRDIHIALGFEAAASGTGVTFQADLKGCAAAEAITDAKVSPDATKLYDAASPGGAGVLGETVFAQLSTANLFVSDLIILGAITLVSRGTLSADQLRLIYVDFRFTANITSPNGPFRT